MKKVLCIKDTEFFNKSSIYSVTENSQDDYMDNRGYICDKENFIDIDYIKWPLENLKKDCLVIVSEECCELAKASTKFFRGKGDRENLIEELADNSICKDWLMEMFSISEEELADMKMKKINRIIDKISKGEFK